MNTRIFAITTLTIVLLCLITCIGALVLFFHENMDRDTYEGFSNIVPHQRVMYIDEEKNWGRSDIESFAHANGWSFANTYIITYSTDKNGKIHEQSQPIDPCDTWGCLISLEKYPTEKAIRKAESAGIKTSPNWRGP
jgi:hypothetical protein